MFRRLRSQASICLLTGLIVLAGGKAMGDWLETFDGETLDVATWQFDPFPDLT